MQNIVAVKDFLNKEASDAVDLFREFDNTRVMGVCSNTAVKSSCKISFFANTNFFGFVDAFYGKSLLEQDFAIKKFINDIYKCYDNKGTTDNENNPEFYSDEFLKASVILLYNVLELDEYTINFMKEQRFPIRWNSADEKFQNCSFMQGRGISQYLFYQYRKISTDEFKKYISDYMTSIFNAFGDKDFLICDQMLSDYSMLEKLNSYLKGYNIKEIVIYGDSRDCFISEWKSKLNIQGNIDRYIADYHKRLDNYILKSNKNRLMIRFEDMILKYEETTKKIMDFIGMDPIHHVAPKSVFDPAISVVNIGAYKQFVDQDFMKQIEERMPEYCYYPEKENLSQEALDLLKGTEND